MSSFPYWLGDEPISVVPANVQATVNGSNTSVSLLPTVIAQNNRLGNPGRTEVVFATVSNAPPGLYMGTYNFNTDINGANAWQTNDTMEYYFLAGGTYGVYNLVQPFYSRAQDAGDDVYITGCAVFSNATTQNISLRTFYNYVATAVSGVSTTCIAASIQKIG